MRFLKKLTEKIKNGDVKEILTELSWIYKYGLRYKWSILWYIILGIFGVVMSYGASVLSKYIIDAVTGKDSGVLVPLGVFYIAMQIAKIAIGAVTSRVSAKINLKVDLEIRSDIYRKIMDADWEEMSKYHSGDLLNRIDNDVSVVSGSVLGWMPNFITAVFRFVGAFGIILYYDKVLAVISLVSAPVMLLISRTTMKKMREYIKKSREASTGVMVFNEESFQNLQVIKSFGITDFYKEKLESVQDKYREVQLLHNKFSIKNSTIMSATGMAVATFCFMWAVYRLWSGDITYGTMTLFLQMSATLSAAFSNLVRTIPSAISSATAAGRVMAIAELPKESREDDEKAEKMLKLSRTEGVTVRSFDMGFVYSDDKRVFRNVDFVAKPGETIAIVGSSGGGKTTMLRLILGIVHPKEGGIEICSSQGEILSVSASTRCMFAYVPQENTLFAGTVAENLRLLNRNANDEEIYEALRIACADDFICKLPSGINTPVLENGTGFSEGQVQRLSIARALLADVPVLLFDEATSALDSETEKKLLKNIAESDKHKTCIITTHRAGVLSVCDRVYKITDGEMKSVSTEDIRQEMMK